MRLYLIIEINNNRNDNFAIIKYSTKLVNVIIDKHKPNNLLNLKCNRYIFTFFVHFFKKNYIY